MNRNEYIKDQIKTRVSMTQIVERYSGRRLEKGKCHCPLHNEKTPSFFVNEHKGVFYCQGCGEGGDQISFAMKYFKVSFNEALKLIDKDFCLGLSNERISVSAQIKLREENKRRALEEYEKEQKNALYDDLCVKYHLTNELLKYLQPMTKTWGQMLTRKAWLEYEMDKAMEGICK